MGTEVKGFEEGRGVGVEGKQGVTLLPGVGTEATGVLRSPEPKKSFSNVSASMSLTVVPVSTTGTRFLT